MRLLKEYFKVVEVIRNAAGRESHLLYTWPHYGTIESAAMNFESDADVLRHNLFEIQKLIFFNQRLLDAGNKILREAGEAPSRISWGYNCKGEITVSCEPCGMTDNKE